MDVSQEHQEDMMDANLMHQSLHMLGQKRFSDDHDMSFPGQEDERPMPKKKGRKKSFIWSHVMTDEQGKVHCLHCGLLIRVNIGEKVERLRKHFVKSCPKSPFHKDSKEYEELLESVAAPSSMENKKRTGSAAKGRQNRVITYSITFVNSILSGATMDLTPHQIERLEALGNRSTNWAGIKLTGSPTISYDLTIERIRNCHFSGTVYIGLFLKNVSSEHGIQVPSGLYNSNFSGTCVLSDNCYVWNTALVANVFLGRNTCVIGCGSIVSNGQVSYGTQKSICVGAESDNAGSSNSRSTTLNINSSYGEICSKLMVPRRATPSSITTTAASASSTQMNHMDGTPDIALFMNMANDLLQSNVPSGGSGSSASQSQLHHTLNISSQPTISASSSSVLHATSNHNNSMAKKHIRSKASDDYIRYDLTIICDDVEISHCPVVANTFIGGYCKVKSSSINNSALLSTCVVSFSEVEDCVMHGNSSICGKSLVSGVLMFPHSHISDGAKVSDSILGPDSSVGVGELKRSILGPFVGFHHTGLLIASLWPLGRGNIGYGAMVGANHTSRSNDQECVPGEGVFFGLASAIRFPFSMLMSPYSIVAANTVCLPQKLAFPFSLIARNETVALNGVVDTSLCVLRPGWCLWANAYFLERSLSKFSKRRKSTEYRTDFPVFRPAIIDMILDARHRLLQLRTLVQVSEESSSCDVHNNNNNGNGANVATVEANVTSPGNKENMNGNNETNSTPAINKNLYLHGAQVDALGGGRCLIAAKDIDVAYESYTQFVLRYALHGLLYMLVTGEIVPSYNSNHPLQFPQHLHQSQPIQQSQHQHLNTSRAYLRTSASLVGASPDSDSEDELEPIHTMRSFSQTTSSANNSSSNLNKANSMNVPNHNTNNGGNANNNARPASLLPVADSMSTQSAAGVSFLLDDLRRLEHHTGTLEDALIRTEARSNREAQQQQRQQLQQHQRYQQQLHHQQQQQQSQQPLLSSQTSQLHHLQEQQQRALFLQHQQHQLLQPNTTMPSMLPPQQPSQQQSSVDNLNMMGINSADVSSSTLQQPQQAHLYTAVSPTANTVDHSISSVLPSTSYVPPQFHSLSQQTMHPQQHTNAATMGMLLFGRSGPAGLITQPFMAANAGVNNPTTSTTSSTNTAGLGHSAPSSINNVQTSSGLPNSLGGGNSGGLIPGLLHFSSPNLIPAPPSTSSTISTSHQISHHHHGSVCILTDSHDVAVRQHQLHLLCDLFPEIDFIPFVDAFARWVMFATIASNGKNNASSTAQLTALQPLLVANGPKIRNLLVRLVELERFYADSVMTSKQKDAHRALDVIVGSADRSHDVDEVMMKARNRSEDITFVVQRLLVYFTQF